jgi:glycosyltransferase involved in cell wall biosynthesis
MAAYNEGPRISAVLSVASKHPLIDEVIVVDDGSKDNTAEMASTFQGVKLIRQSKNGGKCNAVYTGIKNARNDFVFFLDADLEGLNEENITAIITPVVNNQADVTISLRKNSPAIDRLIGLDYISGERVFNKALLKDKLEEIPHLPGFGLEVFFNRIIIKNKRRIKVVWWPNVESPWKHKKVGWVAGIKGDIKMIMQIFRVISPPEVVYQFAKMKSLMVK